jgi:hypothetical protein
MADTATITEPTVQQPIQETEAPKRMAFESISKAVLAQTRVAAALDNKTAESTAVEPTVEPATEQAPEAEAAAAPQKPKGFGAVGLTVLANARMAATVGEKKEANEATTESA